MSRHSSVPSSIIQAVSSGTSTFWINDGWLPMGAAAPRLSLGLSDVWEAQGRLARFASLLATVFPELQQSGGVIESPLLRANSLQRQMVGSSRSNGCWWLKADHALPVAGSIKARGGIYEVLLHAEDLALRAGVLTSPKDDFRVLLSAQARTLFGRHQVTVGSTGNLGLSIGLMAAALGFQATVHMSSEAKAWKKARLRSHGVEVVEHTGDYCTAVAAGRESARSDAHTYFVDDENSKHLFLGYSVAALRLQQQLSERGVHIDARHPLFVYLPCGVGGAPGGITFGLRLLFGDHVHCFLAEPVAAPSMLLRLACVEDGPVSLAEFSLSGCTEADGLAVGQVSEFVAPLMKLLASGVFTATDDELFADLYLLETSEGARIEPSAAAGFRGPLWLLESEQGDQYLRKHALLPNMSGATHVLWTTGGALVPDEEYLVFHSRGREAWLAQTRSSTHPAA